MVDYAENTKYIGALWARKSNAGNEYFSGKITIEGKEAAIVCFQNTRKVKENQPDYNILLSEKK